MKKLLELLAKRAALLEEVEGANEARFSEIEMEVRKLDLQIAALRAEGESEDGADGGNSRTAAVGDPIPEVVTRSGISSADPEEMEYRTAFMNYVVSGVPIEARSDETTTTGDLGAAIPTVVANRIVEKMEAYGMILPLVTQTGIAAGLVVPTSAVKPVATWVAEGASSDRQKLPLGTISFSRYKLRCEVAMSAEVGAMSLSAFEKAFTEGVSKAMVMAVEQAIIDGTGSGQPKGILKETPGAGQSLEVSIAKGFTYKDLVAMEAAIPMEYEKTAVYCMTKKTFMSILGVTDTQGQPVAHTHFGGTSVPERLLLGRRVQLCNYMESIGSAAGKAVVFAFDFADYALNTVYDMGISKKQDWDTEDFLTKAVMAVDGKVLDKSSLVIVKTKA